VDVIDSINIFGRIAIIVYEALFSGVSALALAKYFSAFLTPKTKKRRLAVCLIGVAYFAFHYLVRRLIDNPLDIPFTSSLRTIVMFALTLGASCLVFKRELGKQAFLICSFAAIGAISLLLMSYIQYVLPIYQRLIDFISADISTTPDRMVLYVKISIIANHLFSVAVYAALLLLPINAIIRSFSYKKRRLEALETAALILPCLPAFIIFYAVRVFIASADASGVFGLNSLNESYGALILLSCVFLLLALIASVKLTQRSALLHIEEKNAAILREQIKALQKRDTDGVYAEIRGMRHDMKNHLSNMSFLLKANAGSKSASELNDYIGKMNDTLERFEFAFPTGNAVTDAVIHGRYLEARRKSIGFTSEFTYPASHGIDAYDLAVILQNSLENAAEACEAVPEDDRYIRLRSRIKAETFFVEISNSYANDVAFDDQTGLPITSKSDPREHGLGISNIKRSAEKYRGGIDIRLSENEFTLTVLLQGAK
jgi:hypothetical protein